MEHPWWLIVIEALGAILLGAYLLRRVILTTIYICLLIKFSFRALRRSFRRYKVYYQHFKRHNPHGFVTHIIEFPFSLISAALPTGFKKLFVGVVLFPVRVYVRIEKWSIATAGPWIYKKLPVKGQGFADWILQKVVGFTHRRKMARRAAYAENSYRRYQLRQETLVKTGKLAQCVLLCRPMSGAKVSYKKFKIALEFYF